ncbi:MAG: enoyl-CoA hydratase/isomerase family protein [Candidatus Rokubacteria bacterium]|nr:enoyl-CoA hydratase/isomerase family protein [Candidatus Rokubacteria bacterium]
MPKLLVETRGPVTLLTLNRPEVHNCVDAETAVLLAQAIERFAADDAARVLVVTGTGGTAFCSGADLKDIDALTRHPYVERASPMGFARLDPGKPTLAAVNGYCFAGGMELACWCDFRIAEAHAEFGALNRRWGVPFFDGGTQRFARIVGQGHALWMIETGVRFDARHALTIGLVQEVVPTGRSLDRALELAQAIARYPQASLRTDRQATLATFGLSLDEGLRYEAEIGLRSAQDPEMKAGLDRFARRDRPAPPRLPA